MLQTNYKCADCESLLLCNIINDNNDNKKAQFGCLCENKQVQMNYTEFQEFINSNIQLFSDEIVNVFHNELYFCLDCKEYLFYQETFPDKHMIHNKIYLINNKVKCECKSDEIKYYCKELNIYFCQKCAQKLKDKNSSIKYSFKKIQNNKSLLSSLKSIITISKDFESKLNYFKTIVNSQIKILDGILNKIKILSSNIIKLEKQLHEKNNLNFSAILYFLENNSFENNFSDLTQSSLSTIISDFMKSLNSFQEKLNSYHQKNHLSNSYLTYTFDKSNDKLYLGSIDGNIDLIKSPSYNNFIPKSFIKKAFEKTITCITPFKKKYLLISSIDPKIKLFNDNSQLIQSFDNHLNQVNKIITHDDSFYSCSDDCKVFKYTQKEKELESSDSQLCFNIEEIIKHNDEIISICFVKENNIPIYIVSSSSGEDDSCVMFHKMDTESVTIKLDNCYCCYRHSLKSIDAKKKVLAGGYNEIFVIESSEPKLISVIKHEYNFEYILWMEYEDEEQNEIICGNSIGKLISVNINENTIKFIEREENLNEAIYYCTVSNSKIIRVGLGKGVFNYQKVFD